MPTNSAAAAGGGHVAAAFDSAGPSVAPTAGWGAKAAPAADYCGLRNTGCGLRGTACGLRTGCAYSLHLVGWGRLRIRKFRTGSSFSRPGVVMLAVGCGDVWQSCFWWRARFGTHFRVPCVFAHCVFVHVLCICVFSYFLCSYFCINQVL